MLTDKEKEIAKKAKYFDGGNSWGESLDRL
jgi:hypothetical protein